LLLRCSSSLDRPDGGVRFRPLLGRILKSQGHQVRLLPPHHVRRYRLGNKTDRADADALLEAGRNEQIVAVPVKTVGQQTLIALHNLRSGWISTRTASGLLRELGIVIPKGPRHVLPSVAEALSCERVAPTLHTVILACCEEIRQLEKNIRQVEVQLFVAAKEMEQPRVCFPCLASAC
jgi:transposase